MKLLSFGSGDRPGSAQVGHVNSGVGDVTILSAWYRSSVLTMGPQRC